MNSKIKFLVIFTVISLSLVPILNNPTFQDNDIIANDPDNNDNINQNDDVLLDENVDNHNNETLTNVESKNSVNNDKLFDPNNIGNKNNSNVEVKPIFDNNLLFNNQNNTISVLSDGEYNWGEIISSKKLYPSVFYSDKAKTPDDAKIKIVNGEVDMVVGFNSKSNNNILVENNIAFATKLVKKFSNLNSIVVKVKLNSLNDFYNHWISNTFVDFIEPDVLYSVNSIPNDPYWSNQWGSQRIQTDLAWNIESGNQSVLVAVIDTGIDYNHPDLINQYVPLGYDWVNNDTDPMDDHYHGTHVAGIIAGTINNTIGIAGTANVSIMAEKFLDSSGSGYSTDAANAIIHAVNQGADILSNSWGSTADSSIVQEAFAYALSNGVISIAAAGNDASSLPHYPSSYPEVISVSATDSNDALASFSNYGSTIDIAAPGVDIYSTYPVSQGSYNYLSGTSMATPYVSGVVALIVSQHPDWSVDQVKSHLLQTTEDLGTPGWDQYYGYGLVNAYAAVSPPQEHDMALTIIVEQPLPINQPSPISLTISNYGLVNESDVVVQLFINGNQVVNNSLDNIEPNSQYNLSYSWTPYSTGQYNITGIVIPVYNESYTINNFKSILIDVFDPSLKSVAILNADGSDQPSYFMGGWGNSYSSLYSGLLSNGIPTILISNEDIIAGMLSQVSVLIMIDNVPNTQASSLVKDWYFNGGNVLTFDSSICFLNWAGILPAEAVSTNGYGTYWDYNAPSSGVVVNASHPIMNGYSDGSTVYGTSGDAQYFNSIMMNTNSGLYYTPLVQTSSGSNYDLIVAYAPPSPGGYVVQIWDAYHWQTTTNQLLIKNAINWLGTSQPEEHDISVTLDSPTIIQPNKSILINATIVNKGLNNETNVSTQLWMNNVLVETYNMTYFVSGDTYTYTYNWTPTSTGDYNITIFVQPVFNETLVTNNLITKIVEVTTPLLQFDIGNYINLGNESVSFFNFSYSYMIDENHVHIDLGYGNWVVVNILNRVITDGNIWVGYYYPGQIETDVSVGSIVNWLDQTGIVTGTVWYDWNGMLLEAWEVNLSSNQSVYFHKETGVWIYYNSDGNELFLFTTNMINYQPPEHDLYVTLSTPSVVVTNSDILLVTTITNRGVNNETNIELQLTIDSIMVDSLFIANFTTGRIYTLTYNWTPTLDGIYNITAFVLPVTNESIISNNIQTAFVQSISPILNFNLGDYIEMHSPYGFLYNFTYVYMVDETHVYITRGDGGFFIVDTLTGYITSGNTWVGYYYPGQIGGNITVGSTVRYLGSSGIVIGTAW